MSKKKIYTCQQCGKCCSELKEADRNIVIQEEVDLWIARGRKDLLKWTIPENDHGEMIYNVWISAKTGKYVNRCPWLRKFPNRNQYFCRIYNLRPSYCRAFKPGSKVAKEIAGGCAKSQ